MAAPFNSGHVLALRVFPANDFAPYASVWHRTPAGAWSIYVDGPRLDTACPRYYGARAAHVDFADITLTWTGPMELHVEMDAPRLEWTISMTATPLLKIMNKVSSTLPERLWCIPAVLGTMERIGGSLFDLGDITLSGTVPNGQFSTLMPRRMYLIDTSTAQLDGENLGGPIRSNENPSIGAVKWPARPIFAIGGGYFETKDPVEYRETIEELRAESIPETGDRLHHHQQ